MKSGNNRRDGVEVLIAEDSPTQAAQLAHLLEERGYTVTTAANGREALASIRQHRPTLVISDILMPELDGYGLCRAIKSDEKLKDIPVMLVTSLSDSQDVIRGLDCGADNFIRKPYDEKYLLSRIDYLLINLELRKNQKVQVGVEIELGGRKHFVTAERQQILDLLISTYEQAVEINSELKRRETELAHSNQVLNALYLIAEGLNRAAGEQEVAELVLERALELPGIQAGWISLREGESGFRLAAARNLPPALEAAGAMEGECTCRRQLVSGELASVTNILQCERLDEARGDTRGLRYHASVPLWLGDRTLGVMNLVGPQKGLFNDDELRVLYSVGNQVAVALERAYLREHLERLVQQRTAALEAEIVERKRIEKEQARLTAILEATPDFVATGDLDGHMLYVNPAGLRMIGCEPGQDLSELPMGTGHPDWALKLVTQTGIPHAIEHGTWSGESAFRRAGAGEIPLSQVIIAHKGENGSVEFLSTIARDITLQKEHEERITRLNRVYAVLSGINMTIVRTRDRQELFDEACRIVVEAGQFPFAWIGVFDRKAMEVKPIAWNGPERGLLGLIKSRLAVADGTPGERGLVAQAVRLKKPVISNDADNDPRILIKKLHMELGIHSLAILPLLVSGETVAVLALHAEQVGFFDEDEMKLLTELAGDISFALDHLEKEKRLDYLAYYDVLTGLPNRTLLRDRIEQRTDAAHHDRKMFALMLLDLERFRIVNETLGQHAGDELLRQVARRLQDGLDETDILARPGGNLFAIVTRRADDGVALAQLLEQTLFHLHERPFEVEGNELRVVAKAGVAVYPGDGEDADILHRNAEAALDKAKRSGDRYLFYAPEFNAQVAEKLTLENKLRRAVERGELVLHYQPKIELKKRRISGLEALMRWNDPDTGLVPPYKFIPILEETGLILEAGRWALDQAIAESARWKDSGRRVPRIAVNVSPIQLRQKDFVATVERALSSAAEGILELEITESLIMQDIEANIGKLRAVRDMGVEIAVDDFGTGYSSLSYIARLPISSLKIDRAFIIHMTSNPDDLSIVSTIISLGHSLSLKVVAEGVETEEQANLLRLLKCDEFQGYLFSPAVPAERIELLLEQDKLSPRSPK